MSFEEAAIAAGLTVKAGKQAVEGKYRPFIEIKNGFKFTHSIDLDEHFRQAEPNSNRWDYGLGVTEKNRHFAVWVEPHGATSSKEVDKVLSKLAWLKEKLADEDWHDLSNLTNASSHKSLQRYVWLVPGSVSFRRGSREEKKLAQNGMKMPQKKLVIG